MRLYVGDEVDIIQCDDFPSVMGSCGVIVSVDENDFYDVDGFPYLVRLNGEVSNRWFKQEEVALRVVSNLVCVDDLL